MFKAMEQGDRNALYSRASEAIMWNFANTSRLTIRGGIVSQGQAKWESPNWSNDGGYGLKSVDEKTGPMWKTIPVRR